jgi:hypothetical protein
MELFLSVILCKKMRIRVWTLCGALIHTCPSSFLLFIFTVRVKKQKNKRMAEYYSASVSLSHTLSEEDFDSHSF